MCCRGREERDIEVVKFVTDNQIRNKEAAHAFKQRKTGQLRKQDVEPN